MATDARNPPANPARLLPIFALAAAAAAGYGLAFAVPAVGPAVLVTLSCLCALARRLPTARGAFYAGLATGVAMYAPHLAFFWTIFGPPAGALWLVAGLPVGVFLMLLNGAHRRLGPAWACGLAAVLWTGVEYFRSELYYLRFAWLLPGQAAAFLPGVWTARVGVYGLGFLYMLAAAAAAAGRPVPRWARAAGVVGCVALAALMYVPAPPSLSSADAPPAEAPLHVAGVQLEAPTEHEAVEALDRLAAAHPEAQILVLSEYTFHGPVPPAARDVARRHGRYLVAGGVRQVGDGTFYDTAFVVGPDGRDVFEQAKSVPVQFMADGRPAPSRAVWASPWGNIGVCVCYDLSYARVTDDLVRQGAGGIIIPTMDVADWGEYERRRLHGRVAPLRSAEHAVPTFGVWSSGVSQLTDRTGRVVAAGGYPGQGQMIAGPFDVRRPGRLPPDRPVAMAATVGTGVFVLYLLYLWIRRRAIGPHRRIGRA